MLDAAKLKLYANPVVLVVPYFERGVGFIHCIVCSIVYHYYVIVALL